MDPIIYFLADLYLWWGVPLALIFAEMAIIHRRRGARKMMAVYLVLSGVLAMLAVAYIAFNGFYHLQPALKELERKMSNK